MSRLVLVDTAGPVIGVGAYDGDDGRCVWSDERRIVLGADTWLFPALEQALAWLGPGPTRFAVGSGPGAFTGVRVGVAAMLGLAEALGTTLLPLSSLAIRAAQAPGHARVVVALDARKGRVYVGEFDTRGGVTPLGPERDVAPDEAFVGTGVAIGEGALVYRALLGALTLVDPADRPGVHAAGPLLGAPGLDPALVRPTYLRGEDAVVTLPKPLTTARGPG